MKIFSRTLWLTILIVLFSFVTGATFAYAQQAPTIFDEPEVIELDQAAAIDMRTGKMSVSPHELEGLAQQSLELAEDINQRPRVRAAAYLIYSRILGYQARTKMSPSKGRLAYQALELANELVPNDFNVVRSFAEMILGFRQQNFATRILISTSLGIDLKKQTQVAIVRLENLHSSDPTIVAVLYELGRL